MSRTLTLYRDDSTVQVVYERVKSVFWTAGNTVLVVSQFTDESTKAHRYVHWPAPKEPEPPPVQLGRCVECQQLTAYQCCGVYVCPRKECREDHDRER